MLSILRAGLLVAALGIAGCTETTIGGGTVGGANTPVSSQLVKVMQSKGMERGSPILARVFKEENTVEIWKQKSNGRFDLLVAYPICKMSGKLGPKYVEGDRQSPEGFYTVRPTHMNPNSQYHLAFDIGYPNAYDRAHGRTGSNLMVHGSCSSSGCFSMNDAQMTEIYAIARDSFRGGQTQFQIQSYPFRMSAANMARYRNDPNYAFWKNLKEGYDHFEITRTPLKVDVCEKRYVFNAVTDPNARFSATGACPAFTHPGTLAAAYQTYRSTSEPDLRRRAWFAQRGRAEADDQGYPGSQAGFGVEQEEGARRTHHRRAAEPDGGGEGCADDQPHGPRRFGGRPQDGRA